MSSFIIVAGGKGTRLASVIGECPKVLASIGGTTNLERQLTLAREFGYRRAIILAGEGADQVIRSLDSICASDEIDVQVIVEKQEGGTAGCFRELAERLVGRMLVIYGDISCDFDLARFVANHERGRALATILVQPNSHMDDSDLVSVDADDMVTTIHRKPHPPGRYLENLTNAAAYVLEPEVLPHVPDGPCDWFQDVFPQLLEKGIPIKAYRSWEYLQDYGTPERYRKAQEDIRRGIVGERRANCSTVGGVFIEVRAGDEGNEHCASAISSLNLNRWPVVLFGEVPTQLLIWLSRKGVYADLVLPRFEVRNLDSVCRAHGLNETCSSIVEWSTLRNAGFELSRHIVQ